MIMYLPNTEQASPPNPSPSPRLLPRPTLPPSFPASLAPSTVWSSAPSRPCWASFATAWPLCSPARRPLPLCCQSALDPLRPRPAFLIPPRRPRPPHGRASSLSRPLSAQRLPSLPLSPSLHRSSTPSRRLLSCPRRSQSHRALTLSTRTRSLRGVKVV